jgi:hypothetical protein
LFSGFEGCRVRIERGKLMKIITEGGENEEKFDEIIQKLGLSRRFFNPQF